MVLEVTELKKNRVKFKEYEQHKPLRLRTGSNKIITGTRMGFEANDPVRLSGNVTICPLSPDNDPSLLTTKATYTEFARYDFCDDRDEQYVIYKIDSPRRARAQRKPLFMAQIENSKDKTFKRKLEHAYDDDWTNLKQKFDSTVKDRLLAKKQRPGDNLHAH